MTEFLRYIVVQYDKDRQFVVLEMKDFQALSAAAGYAYHAKSPGAGSVDEACQQLVGENQQYHGGTQ